MISIPMLLGEKSGKNILHTAPGSFEYAFFAILNVEKTPIMKQFRFSFLAWEDDRS